MRARPGAWLWANIDTLQLLRTAHGIKRLSRTLLSWLMLPARVLVNQTSTLTRLLAASTRLQQPGWMVSTRAQRAAQQQQPQQDSFSAVTGRLRGLSISTYAPASNRHAAVLVPLFEDEQGCIRVWLTQRAAHMRSHKGEVCLPGGKREEGDASDVETALREAQEELGLDPGTVTVLCTLPPYLSKHLLSVTPVVAQVPADFQPVPNPAEVGAVFTVPLSTFVEDKDHLAWDVATDRTPAGRLRYRLHSFEYGQWVIWGLTASILIQVAVRALGRAPAFQVDAPGGVPAEQLWHDGNSVAVRQLQLEQDTGPVAPDPKLEEPAAQ